MKYIACYKNKYNGKVTYCEFIAHNVISAHKKADSSMCNVDEIYCWLLSAKEFNETFYDKKIRRS